MPGLSSADHSVSPPRVTIPRDYNAAHDLIERNLRAGRAGKTAFIDDAGSVTYGELAERVNRAANALKGLGLGLEERIMLCAARHHRFPQRVPRRDQGRHRADRRQHAADHGGLRVHAARQPRQGAGRVRAAAADVRAAARPGCRQAAVSQARDRVGQGRARQALPGAADGARPARPASRRRPPATTPASGSIPRARPARPRAPCICIRT